MSDCDETETMSVSQTAFETASQYDAQMLDDIAQLRKFKDERANATFPDEVDTPVDVKARDRFEIEMQ